MGLCGNFTPIACYAVLLTIIAILKNETKVCMSLIEEFYSEITGISSFLIQILILRALLRIQSRCAGIEVKFGHCFPSSAFYLSFVL